jgi:hypothetical protein
MFLAGIQGMFGLAPRLKRSGVTTWGYILRNVFDFRQLAAGRFIVSQLSESFFICAIKSYLVIHCWIGPYCLPGHQGSVAKSSNTGLLTWNVFVPWKLKR